MVVAECLASASRGGVGFLNVDAELFNLYGPSSQTAAIFPNHWVSVLADFDGFGLNPAIAEEVAALKTAGDEYGYLYTLAFFCWGTNLQGTEGLPMVVKVWASQIDDFPTCSLAKNAKDEAIEICKDTSMTCADVKVFDSCQGCEQSKYCIPSSDCIPTVDSRMLWQLCEWGQVAQSESPTPTP